MRAVLISSLIFCLWVIGAFIVRCHNLRDVLINGQIYFVDADCYSRMTRARMVAANFGATIRHHDFENFPQGTTPHTTASLDYLIVGLKGILDAGFSLFHSPTARALRLLSLDFAGALVSPLLGGLMAGFLALFARKTVAEWREKGRVPWVAWSVPLFWTISPILVHGTLLGRPDHQSLLLLLIAVALAAECSLAWRLSHRWGIAAGTAWGGAMWVSFYEPVVLFVAVVGLWVVLNRQGLFARERRAGWMVLAGVLLVALAVDGWRVQLPRPEFREALAAWGKTIGELGYLDPRQPTLYRWLGAACVAAPVLLFFAYRHDQRALPAGVLLALVFALTCWQLRWGYFLALIFAMSLPWQLAVFRRGWIAALVIVASLLPIPQRPGFAWIGNYSMLWEWDARLDTTSRKAQESAKMRESELTLLRETAEQLHSEDRAPFLAPWWISPALAYWSGQPGVAGSSHQSISGIVDTARFYLSTDLVEAAAILKARGVVRVVGDDPTRLLSTSAALLHRNPPESPLAQRLADSPHSAAPFLVPIFANPYFRVFAVDQAKLTPASDP